MYLLYDKEVDEAMKVEQKRLLYWITQAHNLNPKASLAAILNAADDYVTNNTFKIYEKRNALFDKQSIIKEAEDRSALLENNRKIAEAEAEIAAALEAERLAEEQAEADRILAEEEAAQRAEDEVMARAKQDAADAQAAQEAEAALEAEEVVNDEVPVDEFDNFEEPELESEARNFDAEEDEDAQLPERDNEEELEKQNRQLTVRANHDAIFSNQSEISDL